MSSKKINFRDPNYDADFLIQHVIDRSISNYDVELFYKNRIKQIESPSLVNLFELLISILNEDINKSLLNNIYNVAFTFPVLHILKQKKAAYRIEFQPTNRYPALQSIPKKFNNIKIKQVLSQCQINEKSHKFLFLLVDKGEKEFRKEMSELCTLILLASLQDKRNYVYIRKKFRKITFNSLLINRLKLRDDYLSKLKSPLRKHTLRGPYGSTLLETIYNYNKKHKVNINFQFTFAKLIKTLFYMRSQEIVSVVDKVSKFLGENLFYLCIKTLLDRETRTEVERWLSLIMKIYSESNLIKKRLIIAYRSLMEPLGVFEYELQKNRLSSSFFLGVVGREFGKRFNFSETMIDDRYYALGVQFRCYHHLNNMKVHLKNCVTQQLFVTNEYLQAFLNYLNDSTGYQSKYKSGLQKLYSISLINDEYSIRPRLLKVNNQVDLLIAITKEQDVEKRNTMIIEFLNVQFQFEMIKIHENENEQSQNTVTNKTTFMNLTNCSSALMKNSKHDTNNNPLSSIDNQTNRPSHNKVLNDILNHEKTKDEAFVDRARIIPLFENGQENFVATKANNQSTCAMDIIIED